MKKTKLILILLLTVNTAYAQNKTDRMYLANETKDVIVEAVESNIIKYRHVNENTVYSISKNMVDKIVFASGREEKFESSFKQVKGLKDYEKVYITYVPHDIEGLTAKGQVFSKATGVTTLSSINNVTNRAVRKVKMEAAMLGANVVYVGNTFQRGNQYGNENIPGNATMTSISGTAYSTNPLQNIETLKEALENQQFVILATEQLNRNAFDSNTKVHPLTDQQGKLLFFSFYLVQEKDGSLYVRSNGLKSKTGELSLTYAADEIYTLVEQTNNTTYNYLILGENEPRIKQLRAIQDRNK
jgi:hypothetical protein